MINEKTKERFLEIEKLAKASGLDFYDVHFFEVPTSVIVQTASYGLPTRYSHWTHGKAWIYQQSQAEMGFSKIYELILNNNPSIAYLDSGNTDTINLMIAAHCYLPDTYVQTTNGLKKICDIKENDYVFNVNGNITKVIKPTQRNYNGDIVEIQAGSYKFGQTSEHQLFAIKTSPIDRKKYRTWAKAHDRIEYKPSWCEAGDLRQGDFLVVNKPSIGHGTLNKISIAINKIRHKREVVGSYDIDMDFDFGVLIGLFLSEGYTTQHTIGFCFHSNELDYHNMVCELVRKCFKLDCSIQTQTKTNSTQVMIREKCLANYFERMFGGLCYNKKLPDDWIKNCSKEFLLGVFKGFFMGDGNKKYPRNVGFSISSSSLAKQIQDIGMIHSIYIGLSARDRSTITQRRKMCFEGSASGIYDNKIRAIIGLEERKLSRTWSGIIERDNQFYIKINKISVKRYIGLVCCMQVEKDDSFTLANGIITHNCFGHSAVFKVNSLFRQIGEQNMVDVAKQHAVIIDQFRNDYGDDLVDDWIDVALSVERHIDFYKGYFRKRYPDKRVVYKEEKRKYWDDLTDIYHKKPLVNKILEGIHVPPSPEKDILWFLSEYAHLEAWQQKIFQIVRRESYYFLPQYKTKIINEGAASYWHNELMSQYAFGNDNDYGVKDIKYPLTDEEHLDFLSYHEKVVQPGLKMKLKVEHTETDPDTGKRIRKKVWNPHLSDRPGLFNAATRINPYYIGFRIFRDIKEKWDKYYEQGFMLNEWDEKVPIKINGTQKILEVMEEDDDVSFLRKYLSEDLMNEFNLFSYGNVNEYKDDYETQESIKSTESSTQSEKNKTIEVRSKDINKVLNAFAKQHSNYGAPSIVVRRIDESGLLRLEHLQDDEINLDISYVEHVLKYIYTAWKRPVELIRKDTKNNKTWSLLYDGHSFESDYQTFDYPENIEKTDLPSAL